MIMSRGPSHLLGRFTVVGSSWLLLLLGDPLRALRVEVIHSWVLFNRVQIPRRVGAMCVLGAHFAELGEHLDYTAAS